LVNNGFVASIRGRNGGFRLAKRPRDISLLDVLHSTDPRGITLNRCLREGESCSHIGVCPVHNQLCILQDRLDESLQGITFATLQQPAAQVPALEPEEVLP
jgi:Rrf2 family protein